ncbi:hypothetical protein BJ742DRAFT_748288 [Cladochytrium replicatum]|nr:hypothetical protein BJ742DRAFT_748288 [Cladochytrium replicatum]
MLHTLPPNQPDPALAPTSSTAGALQSPPLLKRKVSAEHLNDQNVESDRGSENVIDPTKQAVHSSSQWPALKKRKGSSRLDVPEKSEFEKLLEKLIFQQIEIDEYMGEPSSELRDHFDQRSVPIFRMYGVNQAGNSILCHVYNFVPYFYVPAPRGFTRAHLLSFQDALQRALVQDNQRHHKSVLKVDLMDKQTVYGYTAQKSPFIRIFLKAPTEIAAARRILEKSQISVPGFGTFSPETTFESNISYIMRFMIDRQILGCNWVELPAGKYRIRPNHKKTSYCQFEVEISFEDIISHAPEGDWSRIAPLRILSFDIECVGRRGLFPDASIDPVIQIASVISVQGEKGTVRNVFTLNECANIAGVQTLCYETEAELLNAWRDFVVMVDPDVVTGYNIQNFDFPYLLDRAEALKNHNFPFLGRVMGSQTKAKNTQFSSKAYGTRENKAINILLIFRCNGFKTYITLDMLQVIQRDHKLRSYTLNSVCAHFLGEQKEDVHHSIISDLQNGNPETRRRLAVYCLKDAYLPQRLLDKLMCLINYMEMARVTGVPFNMLLARGQQIKVISQLYRKARDENLLIPAMDSQGNDEQYEGATVIEPEKGFYELPIATLDFTSLYPSIMMAHNLCYSTWIPTKERADALGLVKDKDYILTPNNDIFVKSCVKKGLLPTVLEDLIGARKRAKNDLKLEKDPFKKAVLDGRQLALKISANSVYGFTGATVGKLPLLAISSSVTAFGREMIEKTKELVEERYTLANGYKHDAKVIYGDTDSVMVKFGPNEVEEVMKLGREAAGYVTQHFVRPINLDFEKVYFPYLLINKKRYAGLYWTKPEKHDKLDAKGIETVRRDNCRLVSNVIETCLHKLLMERDVKGAEEFVKRTISDLLQNRIDLSQLVISKALGKAGSAPALGDRVNYVIVKGSKDAAAYEKAEDPIFVLENNLPIDTKYYLENQLSKPLLRIFEPILGDKVNTLLTGDHTRSVQIAAPTTGGLMRFAVKVPTCLGCKVPLKPGGDPAVCPNCKPMVSKLYSRQLFSVNEISIRYSRLWTQCQRCQGSLHLDVICTSQDCPIFYMRKRAQKDLTEATVTLERFDYAW